MHPETEQYPDGAWYQGLQRKNSEDEIYELMNRLEQIQLDNSLTGVTGWGVGLDSGEVREEQTSLS